MASYQCYDTMMLNERTFFKDLLYNLGHRGGRLKHIVRSVNRMQNVKIVSREGFKMAFLFLVTLTE